MVDEIAKREGDGAGEQRRRSPLMRSPLGEWFGFEPFDLFRNFYSNLSQAGLSGLGITRTENGYVAEIPVAGFAPDQIEVTYKDGVVTVSGKNDRRSFTRSLMLSDDIDPETISARVEHGMLMLTLNRHPEAQPKKIPIQR
jgi:HSP20 family molecular chaperone IbpA